MLILTDYNKPYLIDSPTAPMVVKNYWIFNGGQLDYTLAPINYLEETIGTALKLNINGYVIQVPITWFIMISDEETTQLDMISISNCITSNSSALLMTPTDLKFRVTDIKIIGIDHDISLTHPMLQKNTAVCHPIGKVIQDDKTETIASIIIGPHDLFKVLNNKTYGDII
jgi:hypothetical protein